MLTNLFKNGVDPKWMVLLGVLINIEKGIGQGAVSLTNMIPESWIPHVLAWSNGLAWFGLVLMTGLAALSSNMPGPLVNVPAPSTATVVKILLAAFVLSFLVLPGQAMAQNLPKPRATATPAPLALTGNPQADLATIANVFKKFTVAPPPTTPQEIQDTACDFGLFSKLTFENAVPLLEKCAQMIDATTVTPLVSDTQKALDSAIASKNGTNIACLTPALALLQAAQGTPAVKDDTGKVITPAIAAGPILIGEKLSEFVAAGGPSNCKTAVQTTINGLLAAGL
jgi:hypothetical protein